MKHLLHFLIFVLALNACEKPKPIDSLDTSNQIDQNRIKNDLIKITQTQESRNYNNINALNNIADYIQSELLKVCDSVAFQSYVIDGKTYKNVIGSIGMKNKERLIIGAHYDVYDDQQGADDNASGVTGLLELARLLSKEELNYRIDFVAYTLEEPPFFRTQNMGSYIHANYLQKNKIPVKGMICLEMIGYYNNKEGSQNYPIPEMSLKYGDKADFISVIQNEDSGQFGNQIKSLMEEQNLIRTVSFQGSSQVEGVDFSDHLNYWALKYPAVMITDTSFYRNKNYHTNNDTIETLDLDKMGAVIAQLYLTVKRLK